MEGRGGHFQLGAGQLEGAKATCAGCGKKIEIMAGDWTEPETGTWACPSRTPAENGRGGWGMAQPHAPAPRSDKAYKLR